MESSTAAAPSSTAAAPSSSIGESTGVPTEATEAVGVTLVVVDELSAAEVAESVAAPQGQQIEESLQRLVEAGGPPVTETEGSDDGDADMGSSSSVSEDIGRPLTTDGFAAETGITAKRLAHRLMEPPEGVEWGNRWTELEAAMVTLEEERDVLRGEVSELRRQMVEQAATMRPASAVTLPDSKMVQDLQHKLEEANKTAETRLVDSVSERERVRQLSEELQRKISEMAGLSSENVRLESENKVSQAELLPLREERDRMQRKQEQTDNLVEQLREDLGRLKEELNKRESEKATLVRELGDEIAQARADSSNAAQGVRDAQLAQEAARQQAEAAEQRLREKVESFAAERAVLEKRVELRDEQLSHVEELRHNLEVDVAEARQQIERSEQERVKVEDATKELKEKLRALEEHRQPEDVRQTVGEHEEPPEQRIDTQAVELKTHNLFTGKFELVRDLTHAREELLMERQSKEQLQNKLDELCSRLPTLLEAEAERTRLRDVAEKLTRQNEGLLVELTASAKKEKEAKRRSQECQDSVRLMEQHARDIAYQLAVLVHENKKLRGDSSDILGEEAAKLSTIESEKAVFRNIQDIVDQNVSLRKVVTRLLDECETGAQKELRALREEQHNQANEWQHRLNEKSAEVSALQVALQRLKRDRDDAKQEKRPRLKSLPSDPPGAMDDEPQLLSSPNDADVEHQSQHQQQQYSKLQEQLTIVRDEFAKVTGLLHTEVNELRASELQLRQRLATTQASLDLERVKKEELEIRISRTGRSLDERRTRIKTLETRVEVLEASLRKEEGIARDHEATIGQAQRDRSQLEANLRLARSRYAMLEQSYEALVKEKAAHAEAMVCLQAKMAVASGQYRDMKHDLEVAYKNEQSLLKEQMDLSEKRQLDLQSTVDALSQARKEREQEAAEAKGKVKQFEDAVLKLETKLADKTREVEELRASGVTKPRRGAELVAEAEQQAQVVSRYKIQLDELEKKLKRAEDAATAHAKKEETWQGLLATHTADIKTKGSENEKLRLELETFKKEESSRSAEIEKLRERERGLETRIDELETELKTEASQLRIVSSEREHLQISLAKLKDEFAGAVAAARLEGEEKVSRSEPVDQETISAQSAANEWQQRYRNAVDAHNEDIKLLEENQHKFEHLEEEHMLFRRRIEELEGQAAKAAESESELAKLRQRAERAEEQVKRLSSELDRVEVTDSRHSSAGVPGSDTHENILRRGNSWPGVAIGRATRELLELEKLRLERENQCHTAAIAELQQSLESKEKELDSMRLHATTLRDQGLFEKVGLIGELEDENRRLSKEVESLRSSLESGPTERGMREIQTLETELEKCKRDHKASQQSWDDDRNSLEVKFKSARQRCEELEHEATKTGAQHTSMSNQISTLQQELKQKTQEIAQNKDLKLRIEEAQKDSASHIAKHEQAQKDLKNMTSKKDLAQKYLESKNREFDEVSKELVELKKRMQAQTDELGKLRGEGERAQEVAENLKKREEELADARRNADKALGVAVDYQRVLSSLESAVAAPPATAGPAASAAKRKEAPGTVAETSEGSSTSMGKSAKVARVGTSADSAISAAAPAAKKAPASMARAAVATVAPTASASPLERQVEVAATGIHALRQEPARPQSGDGSGAGAANPPATDVVNLEEDEHQHTKDSLRELKLQLERERRENTSQLEEKEEYLKYTRESLERSKKAEEEKNKLIKQLQRQLDAYDRERAR